MPMTELPEEGLPFLFSFFSLLSSSLVSLLPLPFFLSAASRISSISKRPASSLSACLPASQSLDRRSLMSL